MPPSSPLWNVIYRTFLIHQKGFSSLGLFAYLTHSSKLINGRFFPCLLSSPGHSQALPNTHQLGHCRYQALTRKWTVGARLGQVDPESREGLDRGGRDEQPLDQVEAGAVPDSQP